MDASPFVGVLLPERFDDVTNIRLSVAEEGDIERVHKSAKMPHSGQENEDGERNEEEGDDDVGIRKRALVTSGENPSSPLDGSNLHLELYQQWDELMHCGQELLDWSEATSDGTFIHESIACLRNALSISHRGVGDVALTLERLGHALMIRFRQLGDRAELDEAIAVFRDALELRPLGHLNHSTSLKKLADALFTRFGRLGNRADLDQAVTYFQSALELKSPGHPDRFDDLKNLAVALSTRFTESGYLPDLDCAIAYHQRALALIPPSDTGRSASLNMLAHVLNVRFEQHGHRIDLDQAVAHLQSALKLRPVGHPDRSTSLNALANALFTRFKKFGDRTDLDQASTYFQNVLEVRPVGHPDRSNSLDDLAVALLARFKRGADLSDLYHAVSYQESALELRPPGHPSRPISLHNLASTLYMRFMYFRNPADLEHVVAYFQSALDLMPPNHHNHAEYLDDFHNALYVRSGIADYQDGSESDRAVAYHQRALELAPHGHPDHYMGLDNLATALCNRFKQRGDQSDLDQAIVYQQTALELMPSDHPIRTTSLANLVRAHLDRLEWLESQITEGHPISSSIQDRRMQILQWVKEATYSITGGPISNRFQASLLWVHVAIQWSDPSSVEAYQTAIGLLETLTASSRTLESRHLLLTSAQVKYTRTIPMDGAACAIAANQVTLALEILEQGRSLLLTQAGQYRMQVDDLAETHPALALRFRTISAQMESTVMEDHRFSMGSVLPAKLKDPLVELSTDWNAILQEIRSIDKFTTFLQPIPFNRLQKAAANGPVIILNVSRWRTDAIIVQSAGDPFLVPLPDVTPDFIDTLPKSNHKTRDKDFKILLHYLWHFIVHPIIKVLREDMKLPLGSRLWWCPTGVTSHLPLHAAGDYTKTNQNLPALFISSYTPTISALSRAREKTPSDWSNSPNILVVGQSDAPHEDEIPGVDDEIGSVMSSVNHITVLSGPDGTRDAVLTAMTRHPCFHLACHGRSNQDQPFLSRFSLHDGPMTLLDIARQNLPNADLAFLSACHSASGNKERPDEVLHLVAGMQFAGFRSVVGTMWALCDLDGPVVAGMFYSSLLGTGGRMKAESSAHALHRAIWELRSSGVSFSRWACFVHYGC